MNENDTLTAAPSEVLHYFTAVLRSESANDTQRMKAAEMLAKLLNMYEAPPPPETVIRITADSETGRWLV